MLIEYISNKNNIMYYIVYNKLFYLNNILIIVYYDVRYY